jgi:hypothetical protein
MEQVDRVLHDLCQPLTTLRCRLELAGLIGTVEAYREAVDLGLAECVRLVDGVAAMRQIVCASRQAGDLAGDRSGERLSAGALG